MLRRKCKLEGSGTLLRAFEDTRSRRKGRHHSAFATGEEADNDAALEELVFGRQPFAGLEENSTVYDSDSDNSSSDGEEEEGEKEEEEGRVPRASQDWKPVWHDDDDDILRVDVSQDPRLRKLRKAEKETVISGTDYRNRLRAEYQRVAKQPKWVSAKAKRRRGESSSEEEEEEEEDNLLQQSGKLLASSVHHLPKGNIALKRMKDANISKIPPAVLQSVEFHPSASVVLTAGLHKTVDLFQVDGETNPLLQSVHLERFPITTAHFTPSGEEVIVAGQRKWFYVYDMVRGRVTRIQEIRGHKDVTFTQFEVSPDNQLLAFVGKDGYIPLVSNKTKQWIGDLKMNGTVHALTFTPDSRHLLSAGNDGYVYVWDMATRDCVHKFTDEGCIVGNTLAVSPSGGVFACGSDSGVVNIYDEGCLHRKQPRPLKSVTNLTTSISSMAFNHSSEVLAISSKRKKAAVRLVHLSSMTVFSNWPSSRTSLGHVFSLSFSPNSRFIVLGNDRGRAQLYRLTHYHKGESHQ